MNGYAHNSCLSETQITRSTINLVPLPLASSEQFHHENNLALFVVPLFLLKLINCLKLDQILDGRKNSKVTKRLAMQTKSSLSLLYDCS